MRALIQRVKWAKVEVDGAVVGEIGPGVLTLFGVGAEDEGAKGEAEMERLISKILKLRIFEDDAGKMNLSLVDKGYAHLIVSQFTLYGDASKGNRPSFVAAAKPEIANALYEKAIAYSRAQGVKTEGGKFQAHMEISLL